MSDITAQQTQDNSAIVEQLKAVSTGGALTFMIQAPAELNDNGILSGAAHWLPYAHLTLPTGYKINSANYYTAVGLTAQVYYDADTTVIATDVDAIAEELTIAIQSYVETRLKS